MQITQILNPQYITLNVNHIYSKKRALEFISQLLAKQSSTLTEYEIFDSLILRERLGSTGLGKGVALPHGRLQYAQKTFAALIRLTEPIDFDSIDKEPVNIIFALLIPQEATDEHLKILSQVASIFNNEALREKIVQAPDAKTILQLFTLAN